MQIEFQFYYTFKTYSGMTLDMQPDRNAYKNEICNIPYRRFDCDSSIHKYVYYTKFVYRKGDMSFLQSLTSVVNFDIYKLTW